MKQIFSKIRKKEILASIIRLNEIGQYRTDISPENEFIQVSARLFNNKIKISAHKHLPIKRKSTITQETWIIISGKVYLELFDLDDKLIFQEFLNPGDSATLFRGGHSLKVEEENTIMYEIKNGPYFGVDSDKKLI